MALGDRLASRMGKARLLNDKLAIRIASLQSVVREDMIEDRPRAGLKSANMPSPEEKVHEKNAYGVDY